jgi:alkylation response protein AidB-like acyl-CoA dehydrogenase
MKLTPDPEIEEFRAEFAAFLDANLPSAEEAVPRPKSSADIPEWARRWQRKLFDAGWLLPGNPPEYGGRNATLPQQLAHLEELSRRRIYHSFNPQGLGIVAASLLTFGTEEQKQRWAAPILRAEITAALGMSEPGAGSDLAGLATHAVPDGDGWVVDGQKVWTSSAHHARWGILLARTDPAVPKHQGLTYFVCDLTDPGVEVRPLRQLTGEAEFNEVFLTGVRISDGYRLGEVGEGWSVARTTLMNERVSIGGTAQPREGGAMDSLVRTWRERPDLRTAGTHEALLRLWVAFEVARLTGLRLRQELAAESLRLRTPATTADERRRRSPGDSAGHPGPEGSAAKLVFARLNQEISALEVELLGEEGLRYDDWTMRRPSTVDFYGRGPGYRYLRARGNSIEGGTSEILRNIIAERVLGLPAEPRTDTDVPWKDLPR